MIVDFQHHFAPRELVETAPGGGRVVQFDESGAPTHTSHALLCDFDERISMMDAAGIDLAVLTSPRGMVADLERSRFINDKAKEAARNYPGRFIGLAHVHPLGGDEALRELERCAKELGFPGVVITSETDGKFLDAPEFEPFWAAASRLGLYVFIHPALKLNFGQQYESDDSARSVGREFSLILATIKLINSGVLDRHPDLTIHMAHLAGGISSMMGRVRSYQDKAFWGVVGSAKHGRLPQRDFDHYLRHRFIFDTAGFAGAIGAVKTALVELPQARIVFATDYPQEIRTTEAVRDFVASVRALGSAGEAILSGNVGLLLKDSTRASAA